MCGREPFKVHAERQWIRGLVERCSIIVEQDVERRSQKVEVLDEDDAATKGEQRLMESSLLARRQTI